MRCNRLLGPAVATLLAGPSHLPADGGMFAVEVSQSKPMVRSPRQEAILLTDGQNVQVVLRTHFRRGPEELAWVVPVPAKPGSVTKADDAIFETLDRQTAPRFTRLVSGGFGCGCAGGMSLNAGQPLVAVESAGSAGIFDYTVLSAADAGALTRWLDERHYHVGPGAPAVFDRYVQAGWHWLAMRVRPEAAASRATLAPHPIAYTYKAESLVYPLAISSLSADDSNEIVLYVIADRRYACDNWASGVIDAAQVRGESGEASRANYDRLFRDQTRQAGGRLFVTEYASQGGRWPATIQRGLPGLDQAIAASLGSDAWVTRLRAVMGPQAMDRDVGLVPLAEQGTVSNQIDLRASADPPGAASSLAAVGMVCGGTVLARRRAWRRGAGILLVGAACCWAATM